MIITFNKKYNVYEQNINPKESNNIPSTIVIHDGVNHADDIMCVYLMQQLNPEISVIRARNEYPMKLYLQDPSVLVADVGEGFFDHHQKDAVHYPGELSDSGRKAACGLVWESWGDKIVSKWLETGKVSLREGESKDSVIDQFATYVIRPIEIKDVTQGRSDVPIHFVVPDINGTYPSDSDKKVPISVLVRAIEPVWTPFESKQKSDAQAFAQSLYEIDRVVTGYMETNRDVYIYGLNPIVASFTSLNKSLVQITDKIQGQKDFDNQLLSGFIKQELQFLNPKIKVFSLECTGIDPRIFNDSNIDLIIVPNRDRTEIQIRSTSSELLLSKDIIRNIDPQAFVTNTGNACFIHGNLNDAFLTAQKICEATMKEFYKDELEFDPGEMMDTTNLDAIIE